MRSIHLVNPLWDAHGGSERRLTHLYDALKSEAQVRIWSEYLVAEQIRQHFPLRRISPFSGRIPWGGTLVFVGIYYYVGGWIRLVRPRRVVAIYNTFSQPCLEKFVARMKWGGLRNIEWVFASNALRAKSGLDGPVQESLINLQEFRPLADVPVKRDRFVIGRLSRDVPEKFHRRDPELFHALAAHGMTVRIQGGTVLESVLGGVPGIELSPVAAVAAAQFLHGLDCFIYRTRDDWFEAHGRVITEAMASGLPVVCGRGGGYEEYISHGENGFLFDTEDEALQIVEKLRNDWDLRTRIGRQARKSMEHLQSDTSRRSLVDFYLR